MSSPVPAYESPPPPEASQQRYYAERLMKDIGVIEKGYTLTGKPGRNLAVYEQDARMVARWLLAALDENERLRETLNLAETAFDNIARLAELNAEEPGWQVEVHRIACEAWRQTKDANALEGGGG